MTERKTSPLKIGKKHFEEAIYKISYGPERKSKIMSDEEKKRIAYHEAGHAILQHYSPHIDPVGIVTIVPRGEYLGFMDTEPEKETFSRTRESIEEEILTYLGGIAAEEIFLETRTTAARNDLAWATILRLKAKYQFGMSEEIGPIGLPFDLEEMIRRGAFNETLLGMIEKTGEDAKKDLEKAKGVLKEHRQEIEALVEKLIAKETLKREEFEKIIAEAKKAD